MQRRRNATALESTGKKNATKIAFMPQAFGYRRPSRPALAWKTPENRRFFAEDKFKISNAKGRRRRSRPALIGATGFFEFVSPEGPAGQHQGPAMPLVGRAQHGGAPKVWKHSYIEDLV